ncbi:DUF1611 domain-containing protein [Marinicrinis sediminis]|uniref:DUF1611 domain-containing protein n=1 Tax=Marinicrinis sediminis TaxID=1652465 RepID=A0ABW5R7T7_9BACL
MKNIALYPFNKITKGLIKFRDLIDARIGAVIDFTIDSRDHVEWKLLQEDSLGIFLTNNLEEGLEGIDTLILNDTGTPFGNSQSAYQKFDLTQMWRKLVLYAAHRGITVISVHEITDADTRRWLQAHDIELHVDQQLNADMLSEMSQHYNLQDDTEIGTYLKHFELDQRLLDSSPSILKVAIFATRGCLGKFTTQMSIYRELTHRGRATTAIITEPTAFLFQQPGADIMKFLSQQTLAQYPYYIHALVQKAEQAGAEIVLMAGQGSLLPNHNFIIASTKLAYLSAYQPDVTLLVVGYDDDDRIQDCLDVLRIYGNQKKPHRLLLPNRIEIGFGEYDIRSEAEMNERKQELERKFNIEVEFVLHADKVVDEMEALIDEKKITVSVS